ncbi:MAG: hypothetical protein ACRD2W_00540 [Acidimicrobiales bacterium]
MTAEHLGVDEAQHRLVPLLGRGRLVEGALEVAGSAIGTTVGHGTFGAGAERRDDLRVAGGGGEKEMIGDLQDLGRLGGQHPRSLPMGFRSSNGSMASAESAAVNLARVFSRCKCGAVD